MQEKEILRKNSNMVTRVIDEETIILPIYRTSDEINCIYTLNRVASRVWEMLDGKKNIASLKKQIMQEFDTNVREVDKELGKLLADLKEIKAVA